MKSTIESIINQEQQREYKIPNQKQLTLQIVAAIYRYEARVRLKYAFVIGIISTLIALMLLSNLTIFARAMQFDSLLLSQAISNIHVMYWVLINVAVVVFFALWQMRDNFVLDFDVSHLYFW